MPNSILDEILSHSLDLHHHDRFLSEESESLSPDHLIDLLRHAPLLEALVEQPLDRRDIESRLDVSRATSHRFTRWLLDHGYGVRRDGRFSLTGEGMVVTEEILRFERNVRSAHRLAPLLERICPDHQEFVVEPFADAVVTVATPTDPYRPVARFLSLLGDSETFRGFNTTHMVPVSVDSPERLFDGVDTEIIYLPAAAERLLETEWGREALGRGRFTLRTREALPYGLAVFDGRVGIGGYDEETGQMRVFVDTDDAIAREWATRVYETYREHSEPLVVADESE
ncbi:MAG: helix-turn-helix transcriptional regulator [Halobacteriota archaeon]